MLDWPFLKEDFIFKKVRPILLFMERNLKLFFIRDIIIFFGNEKMNMVILISILV